EIRADAVPHDGAADLADEDSRLQVAGDEVARGCGDTADRVVSSDEEDPVVVGDGEGAGYVRAHVVALHLVPGGGRRPIGHDGNPAVVVAGEEVPGERRAPADLVVRSLDVEAVDAVRQWPGASGVGA